MKINNEQLYSRLCALEKVFSYKRLSCIDAKKIPERSLAIYATLSFKKKIDYFERFVLWKYNDLASNISSGVISLHRVDAYFLGEFVRTGKFPKIDNFGNAMHFDETAKFYSAKTVQEQLDKIKEVSDEHNTAIAKFTKTNKSVFELRDDQTNLLYDMLIEGKINIIVYAQLMMLKHIELDYKKMSPTVYRNNKIAEYIASFNLCKLFEK